MAPRTAALLGALTLLSIACPPPTQIPDGGQDANDVNVPTGDCTAPCGPGQKCDPETHQCVSACGHCESGVCTETTPGTYECVVPTSTCGGQTCETGQPLCVASSCSCHPGNVVSNDTCLDEGRVCNGIFNPAASGSGACQAPKPYQFCKKKDCPSGHCTACPSGFACNLGLFGSDEYGSCQKSCQSNADCAGDEFCDSGSGFCYPRSLFQGGDCRDWFTTADGGSEQRPVSVGHACTMLVGQNNQPEPVATGTCTYVFFQTPRGSVPIDNCRPAGTVPEFGACSLDRLGPASTQCGTGLECTPSGGGNGICLKTCNAAPVAGAQPACASDESCVNLYRQENETAIVGVCMKKCNVFSATASTCADYGTAKASCVPVSPTGSTIVTTDGSGLCVPQLASAAAAGQGCAESDAFKGAACQNAMLCIAPSIAEPPTCEQTCDVECESTDGGAVPARCATEPNAKCPSGKHCEKVTSTSGAILGFCR